MNALISSDVSNFDGVLHDIYCKLQSTAATGELKLRASYMECSSAQLTH